MGASVGGFCDRLYGEHFFWCVEPATSAGKSQEFALRTSIVFALWEHDVPVKTITWCGTGCQSETKRGDLAHGQADDAGGSPSLAEVTFVALPCAVLRILNVHRDGEVGGIDGSFWGELFRVVSTLEIPALKCLVLEMTGVDLSEEERVWLGVGTCRHLLLLGGPAVTAVTANPSQCGVLGCEPSACRRYLQFAPVGGLLEVQSLLMHLV